MTFCDHGQGVKVTVEIMGLPSGEEYTAWWLDLGTLPTVCRETWCRRVDLPDPGDPTTSEQRIGTASVQPSGVVELNGEPRDVRLVHGSQIMV